MDKDRSKVLNAIRTQETLQIVDILFSRIYTLRNQILHGGSTFNSSVNRDQLKDGSAVLSHLIPIILDIMMKNHTQVEWGQPFYPVVNAS